MCLVDSAALECVCGEMFGGVFHTRIRQRDLPISTHSRAPLSQKLVWADARICKPRPSNVVRPLIKALVVYDNTFRFSSSSACAAMYVCTHFQATFKVHVSG